jgi:hypothetical protein
MSSFRSLSHPYHNFTSTLSSNSRPLYAIFGINNSRLVKVCSMPYQRYLQVSALLTFVGGSLWLIALSSQMLNIALLLCSLGMLGSYFHDSYKYHLRSRTRLGFRFIGISALGSFVAWLGNNHPYVVFTQHRTSETGQVIDVIHYTVGYIAQRYVAVSVLLFFGLGLLLIAHRLSGPAHPGHWYFFLRLLGIISLSLYFWLVWDLYLDAISPMMLYTTLRTIFGIGWLSVSYYLWSYTKHVHHHLHQPST